MGFTANGVMHTVGTADAHGNLVEFDTFARDLADPAPAIFALVAGENSSASGQCKDRRRSLHWPLALLFSPATNAKIAGAGSARSRANVSNSTRFPCASAVPTVCITPLAVKPTNGLSLALPVAPPLDAVVRQGGWRGQAKGPP